MTPTKLVNTNDDVQQNAVSPTSELGSMQAQNVEKSSDGNDGWRALFEPQQNSLLLVKTLRNPRATEDMNITLPNFEPENADTDARAWLATADICLSDRDIQGSKLILILSKAMKGSAATWLYQVAFPSMKCVEFKDFFFPFSL